MTVPGSMQPTERMETKGVVAFSWRSLAAAPRSMGRTCRCPCLTCGAPMGYMKFPSKSLGERKRAASVPG